ncbi:hypothetical protein [Deefgea rivuli]|uniref:hypothetical protein n=1 Tax=Deefgea rivuli TaxID=400948 RepID=UPI000684D8B3|nr:hypothetical protein [Deefgea rivuli]
MFDIFGLSMVSLALNVLLVFGIGKVLLEHSHSETEARLLLLGLIAAGLLALTVKGILYLSRQYVPQEAQP